MIYIITIFALLLLLNVRIYKVNSSFFNITLNLLTLVSLYAVFNTRFNSVFIIFLALVILTHVRRLTIGYDLEGLKKSAIYSLLSLPMILCFQWGNIHFESVPYLDDVFYSRIPVWLAEIGVESNRSHIEWMLNREDANTTYYHWFELWFANLCDKANGGNVYINLYVVVFSFFSVLISVGLHDIVKSTLKNARPYLIYGVAFLSFIFIIGTNNILDLLSIILPIDLTAYTLDKTIFNSLKLIYIVPICISIYYIATNREKGIYFPLLFSFLYLTTYPAIIGATLLCYALLFLKEKKIKLEYFLPLLAAILFVGYYKMNGDSKLSSYESNIADQLPRLSHIINWGIKAYVINVIAWIIPLYYLYSKREQYSNLIIATIALYLSASALWIVFYVKLDSFQLFYNIINPFFNFITVLAILDLIRNKRYVMTIVLLLITIFPLQKGNSQTISPENKIILDKIEPYVKEKILYLVNPENVNTIYRYNEVFYTFQPEYFIKYEDIQLLYINASYPLKEDFNQENLHIINDYRKRSKYFQQCGEMDFQDYTCLIDFMKEYGFTTIFSEIDIDNPSIQKVEKIEYLNIYKIN